MTTSPHVLYTGSVKNEPREWDWFSACVLFVLLQAVTARLVTTNWAPFLYFSETVVALGSILGLALGASRFSGRAASILAIAYSLMVVPWQLSSAESEDLLLDRLSHLGRDLLVSLGQFAQRQPVKDSLFFVTFVCLAFWVIGVLTGYWFARKGRILAAIVLSGAALLVIQAYANYQPHGSWWLAFYLLMALLLVGRVYFLQNKKGWNQRRVFVNDEAWSSILGSLLMTSAIVIVIAWLIPVSTSGMNAAADWWNSFSRPIRDRLSNAVTSLNGPYGRPSSDFYGSTLSIGQSAAEGDSVVFTVDVLEGAGAAPRFYWRGRVYDQYIEGSWSTQRATNVAFDPQVGDLGIPDSENRSAARFQFTSQFPSQNLMYGPAEPVWLDRRALLLAAQPSEGVYDVSSWQADAALLAGGQYEVRSLLGDPNVEQLRAAGTTYPQWITDRYLQIPAGLRGQFEAEAGKVTAGQSNPYDKAAAVTDYLRSTIKYANTVPAPPEGQDPVAWVLFKYDQGFCNYFASAEVLLLRSAGIPARLAVGFAQGELQSGVYVVRRRDAHAWPEAYFPGYGWIEFEPTVSQAPLVRPDPSLASNGETLRNPRPARPLEGEGGATPQGSGSTSSPGQEPFPGALLTRLLPGIVLLLGGTAAVYLALRFRVWIQVPVVVAGALQRSGLSTPGWIERWIRWNGLQPVERSFASINWALRWLGDPLPLDATPAQRARRLSELLPSAAVEIMTLNSEFEKGLFTPEPANLSEARRASLRILVHFARARLIGDGHRSDAADVY